MKWLLSIALALLSAVPVCAGDLTGTWKGKLETAMGPIASMLVLKSADTKLTGSVKTDLYEAKIENVEQSGGKISFVTNTDFGKLYYEGTVSGDEIRLQVTGQDGNPLPLIVRKQP
jgi:hypothetical protein